MLAARVSLHQGDATKLSLADTRAALVVVAFNGLMYWTRSIRCMILCHGITNLVLYLYVLAAKDWMFW